MTIRAPEGRFRILPRRTRFGLSLGLIAVAAVATLMALGSLPTGIAGGNAPTSSRVSAVPVGSSGAPSAPANSSPNSSWQLVNTSGGPSARAGMGMVYDPLLGAVVLFGGCTSGQYWNYSCAVVNETWTYSNGNWTQLHPAVSPPARVQPAMAYDPETGDVLLFGGGTGFPSYLSFQDTWEFDGANWSQVTTNLTPAPSDFGAVMTYDSAIGAIVMYDSGEVYHGGPFLNDTYIFSSGQWSLAASGAGPSPRSAVSFDYDATLGAVVLFGGNQCNNATGLCPNLGDTWVYSNGTWTNASNSGPPARNGGQMAYDPALNASLLLSGHNGFTYYDDAWSFSGAGWTELSSANVGPDPSEGAGLVYDTASRQMVLFGGYDADDPQFNGSQFFFDQTWTLSGAPTGGSQDWVAVNSTGGPSARAGTGMVYDPTIGAVVVFGGCTAGHFWNYSCTTNNETWTYTHGNWTQLSLPLSPAARVQPAVTYDPTTGDVLLFGGGSGNSTYLSFSDTWEFTGTAWTPVNSTLTPPASDFGAVMTFDTAINAVVMVDSGEQYAGGPYLNDTWTFSGGQWSLALSGTGPSARSAESFDYDPTLGAAILFGGNECQNSTGNCPNQGDTWAYANGTWTNLTLVGPPPRNQAMFAFDPAINASVLFGGHFDSTYYDDTWTYSAAGWAELSASTSGPSPSEGAGLVYDAADQQLLMFGGYQNVGGSWQYNGTEIYYDQLWSFSAPPPGPGLAIYSFLATPSLITLGNTTVISSLVQSSSPVTYSYAGLPTGCASANVRVLDCTPTAVGNYTADLMVFNTQNQSASATVAISVAADSSVGNGTPVLVILSLRASTLSVSVGNTTTIVASVISSSPVTFSYAGLPTGCASANTDILRCTPTSVGVYLVQLTVTNSVGLSAQATLAISVTSSGATIHTPPSPTGLGGSNAAAEEYLLLGAIVGAVLLGAVAVTAISAQAQYRREGEALAREMLSAREGDEERPHP
ncbi:MAG: hypothetical protein L3K02_00415 [Thermoplasmata archaeon]|nr:hypothetical protein [Thermoplasmata archaeon]